MSKRESKVKIENVEYGFQLINVFDGQELAAKVGSVLLSANSGTVNPKLLPEISKQVLDGLYCDGIEVTDLAEHFDGEFVLMNRVVFAGIKCNFPDLAKKMIGLKDSNLLTGIMGKLKSVNES